MSDIMKRREQRKDSRLWFFVSRKNQDYINEYYRQTLSKEYQPLIGKNRVPIVILNNSFFKMFYIGVLSIGLLLILIKKLIKALSEKNKVGNVIFEGRELYLITQRNNVLQSLLKHSGIYNDNVAWLCPPGAFPQEGNKDQFVYSLSLLSRKTIIWCALDSIKSYFLLLKRKGFCYVLEANGAFEWLLYYWTLQVIKPDVTIYFCQTYAPIIVAIGRAPQRKIHVQHGSLVLRTNIHNINYPILQPVPGFDCWTVNSPYKLSNIEKAYSFSEREFAAECLAIFKTVPEAIVTGYNLKQSDLIDVGCHKKSVLIIAFYRAYKDKIEELIKVLSHYDLDILLRVHPQDNPTLYDTVKKEYGVQVFSGKSFPKADVILSYESTLALEYEALGFKVLFFHVKEVNEVVKDVIKDLGLIN